MENNTDKKIADKLKGIEMPYEPEAWQEMIKDIRANGRATKDFTASRSGELTVYRRAECST